LTSPNRSETIDRIRENGDGEEQTANAQTGAEGGR
jgi:hypothetical protein